MIYNKQMQSHNVDIRDGDQLPKVQIYGNRCCSYCIHISNSHKTTPPSNSFGWTYLTVYYCTQDNTFDYVICRFMIFAFTIKDQKFVINEYAEYVKLAVILVELMERIFYLKTREILQSVSAGIILISCWQWWQWIFKPEFYKIQL